MPESRRIRTLSSILVSCEASDMVLNGICEALVLYLPSRVRIQDGEPLNPALKTGRFPSAELLSYLLSGSNPRWVFEAEDAAKWITSDT